MISKDAFAQEVRSLTDTAFAVTYLILGNSADSEDAMSAAILRAFENRGKLRKRDSFRAWFLQILRHEAYNVLRRRKRVQPVEQLPEDPAPEGDHAGELDLRAALQELNEDQRTALLLQQAGYALEEIGAILDVPVGTVKSRLARAKSTLRTILEDDHNGKRDAI
jgi:RNA polymerase sigma-70 factor (ECF subfamily)